MRSAGQSPSALDAFSPSIVDPILPGAAHPAEPGTLLEQIGQPLALLGLERVVDLGHQAHERLAPVLQDGVVARELLAEQHAVERAAPERVHDLLAGAPPLAAGLLLHLVAELLDRGADDPLLGRRGADVLEDAAHEEPLAAEPASRRKATQAAEVGVRERRTELTAVLAVVRPPFVAGEGAPIPTEPSVMPVPVAVPPAAVPAAPAEPPAVNRPRDPHRCQASENQTSNHRRLLVGAGLLASRRRQYEPLVKNVRAPL